MTKDNIENLSFEAAVNELENIVEQLEQGNLSLEDSMKHFERGLQLSKVSQLKLNDAEQKIKLLMNEQGQQQLVDFNLSEDES